MPFPSYFCITVSVMEHEPSKDAVSEIKESVARFVKEPTRENLKLLKDRYFGELDELDFKREWIEKSKLAKHVLAIANTGGGCIFVGIDRAGDAYIPVGLENIRDPAEVSRDLSKYVPKLLEVFKYDFFFPEKEYPTLEDKKIQIVFIRPQASDLPYVAQNSGQNVVEGVVYVRSGTESRPARYEEVAKLIERKVYSYGTTKQIDLEASLQRLRALYRELEELRTTKMIEFMHQYNLYTFEEVERHRHKRENLEELERFIESLIYKLKSDIEDSTTVL